MHDLDSVALDGALNTWLVRIGSSFGILRDAWDCALGT